MKTRKIIAGSYEIDTEIGTFEVRKHEDELGFYSDTVWLITIPGANAPDEYAYSLRSAKHVVALIVKDRS